MVWRPAPGTLTSGPAAGLLAMGRGGCNSSLLWCAGTAGASVQTVLAPTPGRRRARMSMSTNIVWILLLATRQRDGDGRFLGRYSCLRGVSGECVMSLARDWALLPEDGVAIRASVSFLHPERSVTRAASAGLCQKIQQSFWGVRTCHRCCSRDSVVRGCAGCCHTRTRTLMSWPSAN